MRRCGRLASPSSARPIPITAWPSWRLWNIATTIANLVNVLFSSMGASIGIIIGNMLGAGDMEKVKEADAQMITLSLMIATGCVRAHADLWAVLPADL